MSKKLLGYGIVSLLALTLIRPMWAGQGNLRNQP